MEFIHSFKPVKIGSLTAKNRIEVSPAEPFLATRDGQITNEFIAFTASMAKGGAGIVTVGDSPVNQKYADNNHYVVNLSDPFIVHGLVRVTDAIHRHGALASIELNLRDERLPADFSRAELKQIINDFAASAERCKKGGFDMVMLHGGHGHTLAQFYSPYSNKRTDEYGAQNFGNRCRFASELICAVREKIGQDMAIEYRMSGDEYFPEGISAGEAVMFAKEIEDIIDLVHVSGGSMYSADAIGYTIQHTYMPMATNLHLAEQFKKELKIPVTSVGSFNMELAERALSEGKADIIAMIRAFIADPNHVEKARLGRSDEIRPCLRCNQCTGDDPHGCPKPLRCAVNPVIGRHPEFDDIKKAEMPKKVVIIGGGCAGMEAARRLVERGHKPVLFEKQPQLGGSLTAAGANPIKSDVKRYANWSVHMTMKTKGIDLRLNCEATRELAEAEKPDALIIAAGSEQIIPDIPGIKLSNVMLAVDVDTGKAVPGKRVLIVGAGLTGSETAVTLAQNGHEVTVADMQSLDVLMRRERNLRTVHKMAQDLGVTIAGGLKLTAVEEGRAVAENANGVKTYFPCDSVVLSLGVSPKNSLLAQFENICPETYIAGDCANRQGNIASAVLGGFYAAMNV